MAETIPGLRGIDHVGITVPDVEAAVTFYSTLLGAKEVFRLGPFDSRDFPDVNGKDWSLAHVNVADARFTIVMLQLPNGDRLELFQYDRPDDRRKQPPRNCDYGGHHIAFRVDNVSAVIAKGAALGLTFMAGPIVMTEGPAAGQSINYCLDPWGNQLELVEDSVRP